MRRTLAIGMAFAIVGGAASASAQSDFSLSGLKAGDFVYVTLDFKPELSGRVRRVTAGALTIDNRQFIPAPGLLVQRRGDPVWDGAWKGLAVGAVATVAVAASNDALGDAPRFLVYTAVPWMFWGALFDWAHVGRTTVFDGHAVSSRLQGGVTIGQRSAMLTFRF